MVQMISSRIWVMLVGAFMVLGLQIDTAFARDAAVPPNEPRIDYLLHCGGCHGMAGRGAPPVVPSLHVESGLLASVPAGRDYLIRVPGSAQSGLDNAALARVLTWMLESFSAGTLPENFKPFSAREVGRARADILADPLRTRAEIWARHELAAGVNPREPTTGESEI